MLGMFDGSLLVDQSIYNLLTWNDSLRFNRLAWSNPSSKHSRGLLASGMETGEVSVWDAEKILNGAE